MASTIWRRIVKTGPADEDSVSIAEFGVYVLGYLRGHYTVAQLRAALRLPDGQDGNDDLTELNRFIAPIQGITDPVRQQLGAQYAILLVGQAEADENSNYRTLDDAIVLLETDRDYWNGLT